MKRRPSSFTTFLAVWAAVLLLGISTSARADLEIRVSTNGSNFTTEAHASSGGNTTFTTAPGTYPGTDIEVLALTASSNSPGSKLSSVLDGSGVLFNESKTKTETIYLSLGDTGFTAPTVPPGKLRLGSFVVGVATFLNGGTDTVTFQSFADRNNGQNTTAGSGIFEALPQTFHPFGLGMSASFMSMPNSLPITTLGSPYSITETLKIMLAPDSFLSFAPTTTLLVPEPSSMAIAGLGMLGMIGYGVRRRRIV